MRSDGEKRSNRPLLHDYPTLDSYRAAFREYVKHRSEDGTADNHHEQEYDLVRECPRCGGVATISLVSVTEDPVWVCRTGHHSYENQFLFRSDWPGA